MTRVTPRAFPVTLLLAAASLACAAGAAAQTSHDEGAVSVEPPLGVAMPAGADLPGLGAASGSLLGRSGALRVALVAPEQVLDPALFSLEPGLTARWVPLLGTSTGQLLGAPAPIPPGRPLPAPGQPGVWALEAGETGLEPSPASPVHLITRVSFGQKRGGMVNGYHIGRYPTEGSGRRDRYAPPLGFIEVTPQNQDLQVSEHFRLRHFLTKDQHDVWPKYLALDLRLIDKLELVLQELNAMGIRADRMAVMSGFRTPQYNGPGVGGRARLSRHTYGDAADVWVDNDDNGLMDDLNGDGNIDVQDAAVMQRALQRVEARYPELAGGHGLYAATSAHGPFIHIDARGTRATW